MGRQVRVGFGSRSDTHGDRYHRHVLVTLKPGVAFDAVNEQLRGAIDADGLRALPFVSSAEVEK